MKTMDASALPQRRAAQSARVGEPARPTGVAPSSSTPAWAPVVAWGASLLELALGAGALAAEEGNVAARGFGVVLLTLGIAGMGWGAVTLARGRIVVPRAGVACALLGIGGVVGALIATPGSTSVMAVAAASALLIAVALACAGRLRGGPVGDSRPRLAVLFVAAVIVAATVTPALGATQAGQLAPDHSEHLVDPGHH
jgi:hypothetical protein